MRLFDLSTPPESPPTGTPPREDHVALTQAERRKNRQMLILPSGESVGLITERGHVLQGGERRYSSTGDVLCISARTEPLLRGSSHSPFDLCRAAWHLGNRHTAVEITPLFVQIQPDPVLHTLLEALGLRVEEVDAVFEPERGAYAGGPIGGHRHGHDETFADDHGLAQTLFRKHHGDA